MGLLNGSPPAGRSACAGPFEGETRDRGEVSLPHVSVADG